MGCLTCCENLVPGFHVTIYELYDDYNRLNNQVHNPYKREHFTNTIGNMIENTEQNDATWSDVSDLLIKCKYQQPKHIQMSSSNKLKVFSLNIRSLVKNISKIRDDISMYSKFDVLTFNETNCKVEKLPHGIHDLLLEDFHEPFLLPPSRTSGKGGGLATYVNKRVCDFENIENFNPSPDPENTSGEFQFLKLHQCKGCNSTKIVINMYRSPSRAVEGFIELLDLINRRLDRHSKKHILCVGDLNCDLLKHSSNENFQKLINTMAQYGFIQIVSRPTRITDHSATLIDHVYTNNIQNTLSCNVVTCNISDHLGTSTTIKLDGIGYRTVLNVCPVPETKTNNFRVFNEANNVNFRELIEAESWERVLNENCANSKYEKLCEIYTDFYNKAYPLKKNRPRRKNERKNSKPWILPWLEDAIDRKQRKYYIFVKAPTSENDQAYKKLEKFCEKHVDIAKKKYYKKFFDLHKDNSRKQWQMINSLLNRGSKKTDNIKLQDTEGNLISSPLQVANRFNEFFSTIASNLKAEKNVRLVFDPGGYEEFLLNSQPNSMHLKPVESSEVYDIIKNFKNKSTLDSKISALKIASESFVFTEIIAKIVNTSFEQGVFPQALKMARVIPIHKEGSKTDVTNYRPISLLGAFSKIYEKLMHGRLLNFFDKNNLLFEMQYGFRPGRSCEHALLNAQNTILSSLNKKEVALLLLIDFSKAFDMVDHEILLNKLYHYGVRGVVNNWFRSYLTNRRQYVSVGGSDSEGENLMYGVPQGSILGPILFIIYINDLPEISKFAKFILYADDANIIVTGFTIEEVYQKINDLTENLLKWVNTNGLSLNLKKTKYMIFTRKRTFTEQEVRIDNVVIERKVMERFLGVVIDENLSWANHITTIKTKMARYLGIMYKIRKYIPSKTRMQIFHSFVQSHLNYCTLVWGFAAKSHLDSVFRKQKSGIRAVMEGFVNFKFRDGIIPTHTKSTFNEMNVLTVQNVVVKNALIFMHKIRYFPDLLPRSIRETIPSNAPIHNSTYEHCESWLETYEHAGPYYRTSVFYKGPLLAISSHNEELLEPACLSSMNIYKNSVKKHLMSLQRQGDGEEWPLFWLNNIAGLRQSSRIKAKTS